MLFDGKQFYSSDKWEVEIADRIRAGDSFTAGLIYSLLTKKSTKEALNFAAAFLALKHSIVEGHDHSPVKSLLGSRVFPIFWELRVMSIPHLNTFQAKQIIYILSGQNKFRRRKNGIQTYESTRCI